jgi:hypothetical protein
MSKYKNFPEDQHVTIYKNNIPPPVYKNKSLPPPPEPEVEPITSVRQFFDTLITRIMSLFGGSTQQNRPFSAPTQEIQNIATPEQLHLHQQFLNELEGEIKRCKPSKPGFVKVGKGYRLEKRDSRHRFGDLLSDFHTVYKQRKVPGPFFDWLNSLSYFDVVKVLKTIYTQEEVRSQAVAFMNGVTYLDDVARKPFRVKIKEDGLLYQLKRRFSTAELETHFNGKGWAIWVLSREQRFYSFNHKRGEFHHSSFLGGHAVLGAGEWQVENGHLKIINGKSGHYQPGHEEMITSLTVLQQMGVVVGTVQIALGYPTPSLINAAQYLANPQDYKNMEVFSRNPIPTTIRSTPTIGSHRTPQKPIIGSHRTQNT